MCLLFYEPGTGDKMRPFQHAERILQLSEMWGISPEEGKNKNVNAMDGHLSFKLWCIPVSNKDWYKNIQQYNFSICYFWRSTGVILVLPTFHSYGLLTAIYLFLLILSEDHKEELKEEGTDCITEHIVIKTWAKIILSFLCYLPLPVLAVHIKGTLYTIAFVHRHQPCQIDARKKISTLF